MICKPGGNQNDDAWFWCFIAYPEYRPTKMAYDMNINGYVYTHADKDGFLWRMNSGRPTSILADETMMAVDQKLRQKVTAN